MYLIKIIAEKLERVVLTAVQILALGSLPEPALCDTPSTIYLFVGLLLNYTDAKASWNCTFILVGSSLHMYVRPACQPAPFYISYKLSAAAPTR